MVNIQTCALRRTNWKKPPLTLCAKFLLIAFKFATCNLLQSIQILDKIFNAKFAPPKDNVIHFVLDRLKFRNLFRYFICTASNACA